MEVLWNLDSAKMSFWPETWKVPWNHCVKGVVWSIKEWTYHKELGDWGENMGKPAVPCGSLRPFSKAMPLVELFSA